MAGNVFDADAVLAALEPPTLKVGGTEHRGRLLSWKEVVPFSQRLDALVDGKATDPEAYRLYARDLFAAMGFPPEVLDGLPIAVAWPAVNYFLAVSQAAVAPSPPSTAGASSLPEDVAP